MRDIAVGRPPRCPGSRRARRAALAPLITTAVLGLLASGCSSGSGSPGSSGGARDAGPASPRVALGYAACMRSHGVPRYPDPTSGEVLPTGLPKVSPQELGVSTSVYQAAQSACAHLLPNGGRMSQTQSQRDLQAMRGFARCMRSHGVPTWPDPTDGPAGWGFNLVHVQGFDPNSQQIDNKMTDCARHLPASIGVPLSRPGRPG